MFICKHPKKCFKHMIPNHSYLTSPNKPVPIELREITDTEYDGFKIDSETIRDLEYYLQRFREIELNRIEFFDTKKYYTEILKKSQNEIIDFDFKSEALIDFNRCFINFITSFTSLIEHCEKKIGKIFGKRSQEKVDFKTFLRNLHFQNLCYKLAYSLRNYSIHESYPIDSVRFDDITFNLARTDNWYEVGVSITKKKIEDDETLSDKLSDNLEELDDLIIVAPILNEIMPLVEIILKRFISVTKNSFSESADRLIALSNNENRIELGLTRVEIVRLQTDHKTIILPIDISKKLLDFMAD